MWSCTLCWDVLVLQGIYVLLRMPGNVTMSPYWNWTRLWITMMTSSSTTAGGERAVPVTVLMTYYNRPAVSVSAMLVTHRLASCTIMCMCVITIIDHNNYVNSYSFMKTLNQSIYIPYSYHILVNIVHGLEPN